MARLACLSVVFSALAATVAGVRVQNPFGCQDYCVRCNDGSTIWMHRWKSPTKLILAPIGVPLKILTATEGWAPNMGTTCQKMSLAKFDKSPAAPQQCARVEMAKAGWGWQQQSSNVLGEHSTQYYDRGENATRALKKFSNFMNDKTAFDLGCAMLIDENARAILGKSDHIQDEYFRTGEAAYMCASHGSLCGKDGVAGFVDAVNSAACKAECLAEPDDAIRKFAPTWTDAVWAKMKARFLTGKPVDVEISLKEEIPFSLTPFFEVGAKVTESSATMQRAGVIAGSLLLKVNGNWVHAVDFKEIQKTIRQRRQQYLDAPNKKKELLKFTFAPPRSCTEEVMQDVLSHPGYVITKDKDNLHFYIGCRDATADTRKISCNPKECAGDSWCFVRAGCGGIFNSCAKDPSISLTCAVPEEQVETPSTEASP